MSEKDFVEDIQALVRSGAVRTSDHAYGRLHEKGISYRKLVNSLDSAEPLERYPDYRHGPCFLARHVLIGHEVVHAVWGMPRDMRDYAVLITAYWPDRTEWDDELRTRR